MSRIPVFEKFVADRPDDPFPRYALAMEYKSAGRAEDAIASLRELARRAPGYVPTYLQLAQFLATLGKSAEARAAYEAGIAAARTAGNAHALSELTEGLASLG